MGGGGVMRAAAAAAAKVVGITAANGGFRGFTPDHPACAAARAAVRPVAASAISSSASDDVRGVLSAPDKPAVDGRPFLEFDDWGFSDGEESPPARFVFGGAPTLQEAKEATSDLKEAIENMFLVPANQFGSSQAIGGDLSSSFHNLKAQSRDNSDITVGTPPTPKNALQAFRFLSESAAAQSVVASIASDPMVFAAVMENPELKKFVEAHKFRTSSTGSNLDEEECASDNGSSYLPPPKPTFRSRFEGFFKKYIPQPKTSNKFESRSKVADLYNKMKAAVTDMMSSLSDYFQSIFGGDNVWINGDGSAKIGAVEKTLGASFLGLAIMVIMVVVLKRV